MGEITPGRYRSWHLICRQKRVCVGRSLAAIDTRPNHSHGVSSACVSPQQKAGTARTIPWIRILRAGGLGITRLPLILNLRSNGINTNIPMFDRPIQMRESSLLFFTHSGWIGTVENFRVHAGILGRWKSFSAGKPRTCSKNPHPVKSRRMARCSWMC